MAEGAFEDSDLVAKGQVLELGFAPRVLTPNWGDGGLYQAVSAVEPTERVVIAVVDVRRHPGQRGPRMQMGGWRERRGRLPAQQRRVEVDRVSILVDGSDCARPRIDVVEERDAEGRAEQRCVVLLPRTPVGYRASAMATSSPSSTSFRWLYARMLGPLVGAA